jgi:hypothetical protein
MAATIDTRTHVIGDMLMITGTFDTSGGSVPYDGLLGEVYAAGGHLEDTIFNTGVRINNGGGYAAGTTTITVDTVDARLYFNKGEDIYTASGKTRLGTISRVISATSIALASPGLTQSVDDNEKLYKFGPQQGSVTLQNGDFHVGIDTTAKRVQFTHGNASATATEAEYTGRFWILGSRA